MGWSLCSVGLVLSIGWVQALPGPQGVALQNATDTEIALSWNPVGWLVVSRYVVNVIPITSHASNPEELEFSFGGQAQNGKLIGLSAATMYNISIIASSEEGNRTEASSVTGWTLIGEPDGPPNPIVNRRENGESIEVHIQPAMNTKGPITKYRLVVFERHSVMTFSHDSLLPYKEAMVRGYPFYLAAELEPHWVNRSFVVGDDRRMSGLDNPPLEPDKDYQILEGVVSSLNGETRYAYSTPSTESITVFMGDELELRRKDAALIFMLSVAIGVLGFLLVASFIVYFLLRRHYNQKRRSDELILKIHDHNNENGYFGNGNIHLEEGADLNGFYSQLCDLYWQIPRPQLHMTETMLGQGTYGPVRIGKVLRNGQEIPAHIQRCGAHFALSDRDRRFLLSELEAMVRVGSHPHVVEFIGGCEDGDALFMACEHPNNPLRGTLLSSRQIQDNKICTIPEYRLMEMAISLADGMRHLAHRGVTHGHLSTRSVMIVLPNMTPKITNFSLARYTPLGKKLDYTRWVAPESRSRRNTSKGDVWSYGVLLWELFTLGGTPYIDLKTNEVLAKISKGHRLSQPRGVAVCLFQLMLHCWEMDPDERPNFEELSNDLRNVASEDPLRFSSQTKYSYDKFDPLADEA